MQYQLLDEVLARHRRPGESEADVLIRLRQADSVLTELYQREAIQPARSAQRRWAGRASRRPGGDAEASGLQRRLQGLWQCCFGLVRREIGSVSPHPMQILHHGPAVQQIGLTAMQPVARAAA